MPMPAAGEAPPGAKVREAEEFVIVMLPYLADFLLQASVAFLDIRLRVQAMGIGLADDGEYWHLEQDGVQPGAANSDLQLLAIVADIDIALLQMEQAQKVDEIRFDEAQPAEVIQLVFSKTQLAQLSDMLTDLV